MLMKLSTKVSNVPFTNSCDAVKGQDAGTLYPGLEPDHELEIFIDLMCRSIKLRFEQVG